MKRCCLILALLLPTASFALLPHRAPKKTSEELRADYLAGVQQAIVGTPGLRTTGSLWRAEGVLTDPNADYKAHTLNDVVTILVAVQTTAAQSGTVDSSRTFNTNSALTGVGGITVPHTNPLLAANSATTLKGAGTTGSNTTFSTSLTGQVIAVLPNGNLVVEAHRQIDMNRQHEEVIVRGIARPGDITPSNTVASNRLSALEIELKGKGIISDSVRSPNPVVRAILRLVGF
ncbi:MAG: flagellar basal body L-ring protein FlgH [Janthinobacterium lividum]